MSNDNNSATMSFDRMRTMLVRAAEIRDSEQQQVFDALDEIHARLAPLESLGSVRKRLSEMPDRTEVSVLAERVDEALGKLEATDSALTGLTRAVDSIVDKLATPFAELGGRLDGVAGRFEGVAGRMDGLEDRIAGLHKRIDDLDHHLDKQDGRLDGLPAAVHGPVRERIETAEAAMRSHLSEIDEGVHEHLDGVQRTIGEAVGEATEKTTGQFDETRSAIHGQLASTRDELTGAIDAQTTQLDSHSRLETLAGVLEAITNRIDSLSSRLDTVEERVSDRIGALDNAVADRPTSDSLVDMVRQANEESEVRHAGQLDEAMATFAEIIMGGTPAPLAATPPPPPRPAQRRTRKQPTKARDDQSSGTEEAAAS